MQSQISFPSRRNSAIDSCVFHPHVDKIMCSAFGQSWLWIVDCIMPRIIYNLTSISDLFMDSLASFEIPLGNMLKTLSKIILMIHCPTFNWLETPIKSLNDTFDYIHHSTSMPHVMYFLSVNPYMYYFIIHIPPHAHLHVYLMWNDIHSSEYMMNWHMLFHCWLNLWSYTR